MVSEKKKLFHSHLISKFINKSGAIGPLFSAILSTNIEANELI